MQFFATGASAARQRTACAVVGIHESAVMTAAARALDRAAGGAIRRVRVTVGVSMHWFVGYLCHTHGPQSWLVDRGAVQAHNVPWAAIPSMGESWHNNHHAFPASARHGLYPGQLDLGFNFVKLLERVGLAWDIQTPDVLPPRAGITAIASDAQTVRYQAALKP